MKKTAEQKVETKYEEYSYKPDAKVEISGAKFSNIMNLLVSLIQDEQKMYFKYPKDETKSVLDANPELWLTPKGMTIEEMIQSMMQVHFDNVDKGNATLITELQKPQIELVK